jgi:hypothetical protein
MLACLSYYKAFKNQREKGYIFAELSDYKRKAKKTACVLNPLLGFEVPWAMEVVLNGEAQGPCPSLA